MIKTFNSYHYNVRLGIIRAMLTPVQPTTRQACSKIFVLYSYCIQVQEGLKNASAMDTLHRLKRIREDN